MEREMQVFWGAWYLRNDMVVNSLGFLFCLIYPILHAREAGNPETPMSTDEKPQEKLVFFSPTGKRQLITSPN